MRDTNEIKIEKLIFGGMGLARIDGKAIFVEGGVPGDEVEILLSGKKGGVETYSINKIIEPSPERRDAKCQYYGECGGCDWLHIDYEYQKKCKRDIFKEQLQRVGKVNDFPEPKTISSKEYGYRGRAQIKVDWKNRCLGFFKRGSNDIVKIDECPLLCGEINELLKKQDILLSELKDGTKQIKTLIADNGIVSFPFIEDLTNESDYKTVENLKFLVNGKNFFQSNQFLLSGMGKWVRENAKGETFIDMYGGLGFFSIFLSDKFKIGTLVESDRLMTKASRKNFKLNGIKNVESIGVSSEKFFGSREAKSADCIIVDPPRPGLTKKVRLALGELLPKQIIYISCNPSTQARDVGFFINHRGYKIKDAVLFDLYPNTNHMETGLVLER